jgi:uncharacterized zinc-type alcohol dehydrogenase-like protein
VAVEERERLSPSVGQFLYSGHACGVCHSNLAVLQAAFLLTQFPLVPDHKVASGVEKVGEGVTWMETGARPRRDALSLILVLPLQAVHARREGAVPGRPACFRGQHRRRLLEVHARPSRLRRPIPDALVFVDAPLMCACLPVYNGLQNARFEPAIGSPCSPAARIRSTRLRSSTRAVHL